MTSAWCPRQIGRQHVSFAAARHDHGDAARLVEMEASARALARPDAAQRIAHRVLELAGAHATAPEAAFV